MPNATSEDQARVQFALDTYRQMFSSRDELTEIEQDFVEILNACDILLKYGYYAECLSVIDHAAKQRKMKRTT